jgi:lipopolysaccharide transport system permease protein
MDAISSLPMSARIPGKHFLRNLIERRTLLFQLVRRDFEQRFVGSVIGWIWGIIHPLVLLLSWYYIFVLVMHNSLLPGEVTRNYPLFIFSGMLPWMLFSETVQRSASSLLEHANLITKSMFPAEIVPVAVFLSNLASHALALALMIVATLYWNRGIGWAVLLIPVYLFFIGLFSIGLGWIASSLQVFLRDTAQMVSVILTFWFWLTPIMVPASMIPERYRWILHFNPMYYAVDLYRQAFFTSRFPDSRETLALALSGIAMFAAGGLFFRYVKRGFADVL